jgi:hypothetical protein
MNGIAAARGTPRLWSTLGALAVVVLCSCSRLPPWETASE